MDLDALRETLAQAVRDAGMTCEAYPPDNPSPPTAWVDTLVLDYQTVQGFCDSAEASAVIVTAAQRNDRPGGMRALEGRIPDITKNLEASGPVRVTAVESGTTQVATVDLPAVLYRVSATIAA